MKGEKNWGMVFLRFDTKRGASGRRELLYILYKTNPSNMERNGRKTHSLKHFKSPKHELKNRAPRNENVKSNKTIKIQNNDKKKNKFTTLKFSKTWVNDRLFYFITLEHSHLHFALLIFFTSMEKTRI